MIPRYGFNKCLISEFSFNVFVQYHNRLLGIKLYSRGEFIKFYSRQGEKEEIECVRFMRRADVTFLLRNKNVTSWSESGN